MYLIVVGLGYLDDSKKYCLILLMTVEQGHKDTLAQGEGSEIDGLYLASIQAILCFRML